MKVITFGDLYNFLEEQVDPKFMGPGLELVEQFCEEHDLSFENLKQVLDYFGINEDYKALFSLSELIDEKTIMPSNEQHKEWDKHRKAWQQQLQDWKEQEEAGIKPKWRSLKAYGSSESIVEKFAEFQLNEANRLFNEKFTKQQIEKFTEVRIEKFMEARLDKFREAWGNKFKIDFEEQLAEGMVEKIWPAHIDHAFARLVELLMEDHLEQFEKAFKNEFEEVAV